MSSKLMCTLILLIAISGIATADITSGLVGHWTFNEGSGTTAFDSSGNGNNGTLVNNPTWITGKVGSGALNFNSSNSQKVSIGSLPLVSDVSEFSVSAWAKKTNNTSSNTGIISQNDNPPKVFTLESYSPAYRNRFIVYNLSTNAQAIDNTFSQIDTNWHHYVGVYDTDGNISVYVDGVLANKVYLGGNTNSGSSILQIGRSDNGYFDGSIDDVRIYSRAISASEISELYALGSGSGDNEPPTVSITAPSNGATVSGSVTVSATALDNVGVSGVQFKLDGSNLQSEDTSAPYSITWDTTGASNGLHSLTATARDAAGNITTASAVSVTTSNVIIDTTPASLSSGSPTGTLSAGTTSTTMSVITNENAICKYGTTANTAYSSIANTFTNTGGTTHSTSLSGLADGSSYAYYVRCQDTAGNSNTSDYAITFSVSPPSGGGIYYVDQNNANAADSNPGTEALPFKTIQKAADVVNPGDTVLIKAGTYVNKLADCQGATCRLMYIVRSGTAGNPITFKAYGNGKVILRGGLGFEDRDLDGDGLADGPLYPAKREHLIYIKADYIIIQDLELENSMGAGIGINGSYNTIENVLVHDNWSTGISIGGDGEKLIQGNTVKNVEARNSRHGNGISISISSVALHGPRFPLIKTLIVDSLAYMNGRLPDGTKVLPASGDTAGGGNSDGAGASKICTDAPEFNPEILIENLCPNNVFRGNVVWLNADDGFDVSIADSLFEDNISFGNGPEGTKGYKVLREVKNLSYVGNIAYANYGRGFEPRISQGGVFLNNLSVGNGSQGFLSASGEVKNNIGYANSSNDLVISNCIDCTNNITGDGSSGTKTDPDFANVSLFKDINGNISVTFPSGLTIAEKVAWIKSQFRAAFTPSVSSDAIDAGVIVSYTDPITGETIVRPYSGTAPDIGAFEYDSGSPSINGSCSTTLNTCITGTLLDTADTNSLYKWSCVGSNGGTTANCTKTIPSQELISVCGDAVCDSGETCSTCSTDCGECQNNDTGNEDTGSNDSGSNDAGSNDTGGADGSGGETGTEGYKALTKNLKITPLQLLIPATISLQITNGIPVTQAMTVKITIVHNKTVVYSYIQETPSITTGQTYSLTLDKKWTPDTPGEYTITTELYSKNAIKYDTQTKTITINATGESIIEDANEEETGNKTGTNSTKYNLNYNPDKNNESPPTKPGEIPATTIIATTAILGILISAVWTARKKLANR